MEVNKADQKVMAGSAQDPILVNGAMLADTTVLPFPVEGEQRVPNVELKNASTSTNEEPKNVYPVRIESVDSDDDDEDEDSDDEDDDDDNSDSDDEDDDDEDDSDGDDEGDDSDDEDEEEDSDEEEEDNTPPFRKTT